MDFPKNHRDALDDFSTLSDQGTKAMLVSLVDLIASDTKGAVREVSQLNVEMFVVRLMAGCVVSAKRQSRTTQRRPELYQTLDYHVHPI